MPRLRFVIAFVVVVSSMVAAGCMFFDVREQQASLEAVCLLSGTVTSARKQPRPIVVVLFRQSEGEETAPARWKLVDHFVLERPGRWGFGTGPGRYAVAAFEDRSRDVVYQPGEPYGAVAFDKPLACGAGSRFPDLLVAIPEKMKDGFFPDIVDIAKLQARNLEGQLHATMGQLTATGEIASLTDARFRAENAEDGLWRPFDFLLTSRAGVYFLEPYDPRRIPVLFVHGINGTPANFEYLIERLDRSRFQAWVYYYPSGLHLGTVANHLTQTIAKLKLRHGFHHLAVVAHSMGGLVSRGFIQRHAGGKGNDIPLFVSLSTPWGGHKSAELGVRTAPVVVHVWRDMAPGSEYQKSLYVVPLPPALQHHLVFTFNRKSSSFGESDDQTVTVASQLLSQAQRDATKIYGFDDTHTGVLRNAQVSLLINQLLEQQLRR